MQEITQFVSDHPMLCLAWVALLIAVIVTTFKNRFSKVNEISRGEAIRLINKEDAAIVDLRTREDYRKGHIANALNLTSAEIKNGSLGELDKAKTKPVIVVCATGSTSREPAENLSKAGFERVYVLKEGISGWSGENLPLVRGK
ncbi:rhodanese-like domain-containing protein [Acerihabitans sp.]|uniref:rhodanese-like domain-containing protein n=1 Tax=Acerihabitans sp. TaxID=2811394 RepID=UPI002ED9FF84